MDTQNNPPVVSAPELNMNITPPDNNAVTTPPNPEAIAVQPKKEIFFAGRKFDSEADALAYASSLAPPPAPVHTTHVQDEVTPGKVVFEDPDAAFRISEERIISKMEQRYTAVEQQKKIWTDFYDKHKDLKGMEEFVNASQQSKWEQIKNLPIDQALEQVAKDTRAMIAKARGNTGVQERMNPNGAQTLNPSPAHSTTTVVHTTKPTTFVDEMKAMRAKRQKVV